MHAGGMASNPVPLWLQIDGTKEKALMNRFKVTGYPSIYLLREGRTYTYSGARNVQAVRAGARGPRRSPVNGGVVHVHGQCSMQIAEPCGSRQRRAEGPDAFSHPPPVAVPSVFNRGLQEGKGVANPQGTEQRDRPSHRQSPQVQQSSARVHRPAAPACTHQGTR